jgi:hypothetical protein
MVQVLLFWFRLVVAAGKYLGGSGFEVQGSKAVLDGPCRQYLPEITIPDIF